MNRQRGMTMVELLISVAIVMVIIGAATTAYLKILRTYKTQGKLAENYMANLTGLEMLRYDIEMAGFGLPAGLGAANYTEASDGTVSYYNPANLNDSPNTPPRALAHLDNSAAAAHNSDVLAIKSTSANVNATSKRWSLIYDGGTPQVKQWNNSAMDFTAGPPSADNVIVIDFNGNLVLNAGQWCNAFKTAYFTNAAPIATGLNTSYVYYVYGLDNSTNSHRMPFNRVDYYLDKIPAQFPSTCAASTFTLYRSTIDQQTGLFDKAPLVDCVRDFQVAFGIDPSGNNTQPIQWQANLSQQAWMQNYIAGNQMSAWQIQTYLREVRVFILYQDGLGDTSKSPSFRFSGVLNLGDQDIAHSLDPGVYSAPPNSFQQLSAAALPGALSTFTPTGADCQYRWKILEMDVKPMNLMNLPSGTPR